MKPLVSILMPFLNVESYLESAIQSVRNQTFPDWELILVDDGSTDASLAIASAMAQQDARISLYINPANRGIAASCNRAFAVAKGQWIARCDADDLALPHRLEKQLNAAETRPEVGVWGSSAFERAPRQTGILTREDNPLKTTAHTLFRIPIINTTFLMRRSLIAPGQPLYDSSVMFEDYHLLVRLAGKTLFNNLNEPLMVIRKHADSFTGSLSAHDHACQNIRYQELLLRRMGLTPSATEMNLHDALVAYHGRVRNDQEFGDILDSVPTQNAATRWFEAVAKANAASGLLPHGALLKHMEEIVSYCPTFPLHAFPGVFSSETPNAPLFS